jgi:Divergent InlB B-repeat domain
MRDALRLRHVSAALAVVALTAGSGASAEPAAKRTLRVTTDGNGVVTTGDRRINCGSRCAAAFRRGSVVRLAATPARFFAFARWRGACVGTSPRCVVALDASRRARAEFTRKAGSIQMAVGGPGVITSSPGGLTCGDRDKTDCAETYPQGTTVTLTPAPSDGGAFGVWGGACSSAGQGPCTLVVEGDVEVLAAFRHTDPDPDQPQLLVTPDGVGVTSDPAGINCPPVCEAEFPTGTVITLTGDAKQWDGACVGVLNRCLIILDSTDGVGTGGPPPPPAPRRLGVSVTVSGPGAVSGGAGTILCGAKQTRRECEGLYREGTTIFLKATPARGRRFARWSGFCLGKKRMCTLRVTAPKTVEAFFRR